jgi:fructose-specific component phosphotransferase system IIB-like protein
MNLDRQFAEAPILADSEYFALRVTQKLDRGWTFRQLVIGGLGLAGGLIGAGQILNSGLLVRAGAVTAQLQALVKPGAAELPVVRSLGNVFSMGSTMNGQALWMSAALAALAVGLLVTRAIRDI